MELSEQEQIRRDKLTKLRAAGQDPFLEHRYDRTHAVEALHAAGEEVVGQTVTVAGRLQAVRGHGKAVFADLHDESGRIQVYAKLDVLGEERFAAFQDLDLGDIIGVHGELFRTRSEELTVRVDEFTLLAKALRPLPEKFHGLHDPEIRYRQRYLDLISEPGVKQIFRARAALIRSFRDYLTERDFLEVETPILQPIYGGAAARPFTTHHNALEMSLFMRIAPELYLKRLLVGGFERVFEIGRMFRNEGIDIRHNPEFTMMEVYQAYTDVNGMMELVEGLVGAACLALHGQLQFTYRGHEIDVTPPWRRLPLLDAVREASGLDLTVVTDPAEARAQVQAAGLEIGKTEDMGLWEIADKVFDRYVQPNLIQPTFVTDYPVAISPLAKRKAAQPELTDRFEVFIGGEECGNAFSELNDPEDQRARFEEQVRNRQAGDVEAHPMDEDYLVALEYGMPPAGGLGMGMDRLIMLLADQPNMREVLLFPLLRPLAE
ncbi:MAG TPA: lysine--tRNA ligase [Armatimonadota bacterium]|jgi:lysyl-tRNA synthetase class 2